jgi:ferredoxin
MSGWCLTDDELRGWLGRLLDDGKRVIAPVRLGEDGLRLFRPVTSANEVDLDPGKTRWSPKDWLFPRTETLYEYTLGPEGPDVQDPPLLDEDRVLFGVRPCDAAGLCRLDEVFLSGKVEDPFYAERRERTLVVALACPEAEPECFCTAVGGSPMGMQGADLLVIPLGADWLLSPVTEKGDALADPDWRPADDEIWARAREQETWVSGQMTRAPVPEDCATRLENDFESPVWKEFALRCMSCSICAYACPSCSCFDVQHEGNAWGGREIRSWDACTFPLFTLHASGHNPRGGPDARYRQRVMHKFAYLAPGQEGVVRCVGCGRCVALCPAGIDIHDAVSRIVAPTAEGGADG